MRHSFEEDDVEEILKRAITIDALQGSRDRASLMRAAEELGISPEAVAEAEKVWQQEKQQRLEMQEFVRHQRKDYWPHLFAYIGVNVFLLAMDYFQTGRITWSIYPLLGWGIGIFFHTMGVFWTQGEDFEKEFEKWRQERRSKEALPE